MSDHRPGRAPKVGTITIRLSAEDERLISFLQLHMGISSVGEVFRAALRAQRRETERSTGAVFGSVEPAPTGTDG